MKKSAFKEIPDDESIVNMSNVINTLPEPAGSGNRNDTKIKHFNRMLMSMSGENCIKNVLK